MFPFVAALTAVTLVPLASLTPLAAQQEAQRVVRGLSFEGNHAIDDYTLSTAIATTSSGAFASRWWLRWMGLGEKRYFNELEFRRDVLRLLLLYRQGGYMNAVVDTLVRREGGDAYVTFRIYEGDPVRLAKLDVVGVAIDSIFDVAALKRSLPLQVGDPFNRALFQASADTIVSRLRNRGYPFADILRSFDVDAAELRANATLEAVPGPRMRIGDVSIRGADQTDTATVRSMLSVKPGDWFRQDQLYQTQRDLYGLGMFRSVSVTLADTASRAPGDSAVRIVVRVSEAPRHRIRVGGGYGSLDCFRVQTGWTAYDFLGGARSLDLTGQLSKIGVGHPFDAGFKQNVCGFLKGDSTTSDTANYNATITLRQPVFLSPRHTASLAVFAERRSEFEVYTRQAVGTNVAVTFNARRDIPVTVGYSYSVGYTTADAASFCRFLTVCNVADQSFFTKSRAFGAVTVSGVRGRVNSALDPSVGSVMQVTLVHASRYVLSDTLYEFNRGEIEISTYYPLSRRSVLAWRIRGGTILPQRITLLGQSTQFVPPDQRFYAGGPNSVRGYTRNGLGPRVYVSDSFDVNGVDTTYRNIQAAPTGGNTVLTANLELRIPAPIFPERVRLGVFADVGQVWERGDPLSKVSGLRVTPGVGLRFVTPLGPVRLDAAFNGYPQEPGRLYYLHQGDLTSTRRIVAPGLPPGFWRRVVVQFAVGQAF
ncbi:MAG TPA: BamA/TamA family outer membrane protein [Gemmatimonadales bacterium]|nr:BamA/TamA family outer membrane protein [Gemmatimonadales bacterium]